jgi:hypothetical protein
MPDFPHAQQHFRRQTSIFPDLKTPTSQYACFRIVVCLRALPSSSVALLEQEHHPSQDHDLPTSQSEQSICHDALKFPDGQIVLLMYLMEDQEASVLQRPASVRVRAEPEPANTPRLHIALGI